MRKIAALLCLIKESTLRTLSIFLIYLFNPRRKPEYPKLSIIYEVKIILFGPRAVFDSGIEIRDIWEKIRKSNFKYIPFMPSHLNGLEIAFNILQQKNRYKLTKSNCVFYLIILFLNDESHHKGNHSIACLAAKSYLFEMLGKNFIKISRKYRLRSLKEYRRNLKGGFYDEGSTHYHIFTTYIFELIYCKEKLNQFFRSNITLSKFLINNEHLAFGDSDPFVHPEITKNHNDIYRSKVILQFMDKYFWHRRIEGFDIYVKKKNYGEWGHEKNQCGDVRVIKDKKIIITAFKDESYTKDFTSRMISKYNCKNGAENTQHSMKRFFEPVEPMTCTVEYTNFSTIVNFKDHYFKLEIKNNSLNLSSNLEHKNRLMVSIPIKNNLEINGSYSIYKMKNIDRIYFYKNLQLTEK